MFVCDMKLIGCFALNECYTWVNASVRYSTCPSVWRGMCMCMTHRLRCTSAPFHTGIQPAALYPDVVKTRPARHSGYGGRGLFTLQHLHTHLLAFTNRYTHTHTQWKSLWFHIVQIKTKVWFQTSLISQLCQKGK